MDPFKGPRHFLSLTLTYSEQRYRGVEKGAVVGVYSSSRLPLLQSLILMGNHKFRLSDMMPNAWFYKLNRTRTSYNSSSSSAAAAQSSNRHQQKTRKKLQHQHQHQHQQQQQQQQQQRTTTPRQGCSRKSYYFTRDRDNNHPTTTPTHSKSSSSADSLFPDPPNHRHNSSPKMSPHDCLVKEMRSDRALPTESSEEKLSWSSSCNDEPRNIVIDIDGTKQLAAKIENSEDFVTIFDLELRPILTKPKLPDKRSSKVKVREPESRQRQSVSRKFQGMKLRVNSPRVIPSKRLPANGRRSLSSSSSSSSSKKSALAESLAIVKTSMNPQEDFKQSMVEMIVEHGIRSSKDLEELLACYLSLNSDEYHDLIISVFKQIWIQLSGLNNTYSNSAK